MSKLHLVFGGRVTDPRTLDFADLKAIDVVGVFGDYASADAMVAGDRRCLASAMLAFSRARLIRTSACAAARVGGTIIRLPTGQRPA